MNQTTIIILVVVVLLVITGLIIFAVVKSNDDAPASNTYVQAAPAQNLPDWVLAINALTPIVGAGANAYGQYKANK